MDDVATSPPRSGPILRHPAVDAAPRGERALLPITRAPHVSVIVTNYGYAPFITRALASVAAQSYADFSCVIVDDASTDDSVAVIMRWLAEQNDPRFKLIRKDANAGQLAAIATGLVASDGQFVALL